MTSRERRMDRADRLMQRDLEEVGAELRRARLRAGLSLKTVAAAMGSTPSTVLRDEMARSAGLPPATLARHAAAVGLRARLRVFPEGAAIHDAGQVALIRDLRARIGHPEAWAFEVPIPIPGDRRAFDAVLTYPEGRIGLEFYTRLADAQAQLRQARLKQRDAGLERLVIVVRASSTNRRLLREGLAAVLEECPGGTRHTMASLAAARLPAANGVILL
jgi:transcriptional regulator with XRE-family HTH domain